MPYRGEKRMLDFSSPPDIISLTTYALRGMNPIFERQEEERRKNRMSFLKASGPGVLVLKNWGNHLVLRSVHSLLGFASPLPCLFSQEGALATHHRFSRSEPNRVETILSRHQTR